MKEIFKRFFYILMVVFLCLSMLSACKKKEQSAYSKIGEGVGQIIDEKTNNKDKSMSKVGSAAGEVINSKGDKESVENLEKTINKEIEKKAKNVDNYLKDNLTKDEYNELTKAVNETTEELKDSVNKLKNGLKGLFGN